MKVNIQQKEKKRTRKRGKAFSSAGFSSLNGSFQTKPQSQSYGVTQKEGSEELSSHTPHKCSLGASRLRLAQHSSIKAQPAGAGMRDTEPSRMHLAGCIHRWTKPLACGSLLANGRSSSHTQKVFVLWTGSFKSVTKQGQVSGTQDTEQCPQVRHASGLQI